MNFFKALVALFHFNRTNWKAVALCLLAAVVFWLFNALNRTYSTNINFPIQFEYDQRKYAAALPLPKEILINVNGNGWDLFRKHFGIRVPTLVIPLDRPTELRRIPGNSLPVLLMPQMGGLNINFVVHDTIRLKIENRVSKKFKLKPDESGLTFKLDKTRTSPIVVLPDSVELDGPESLVQGLPDTLALHLDRQRIDDDFREQVEVELAGQEFVKRDPPVVEVRFEVSDVAHLEKSVPLSTEKFPWGFVAGRDSVSVGFEVPVKFMEIFESSPIHGLIDLTELEKGETRSYLPVIVGVPPYIKVNWVDSVRVKRY
jgi:hypothetical protein